MRNPAITTAARQCGARAPGRSAFALAIGAVLALASAQVAHAQKVEQGVAIVSEAIASRVDGFSYRPDSSSELEFRGTTLAPRTTGKIKVRTTNAATEIDARLEHLPAASSLGPLVVYVLWVITVEGQPHNIGAVEVEGDKGRVTASTPLSSFALIVTAEPHFAVSVPSKFIVLQTVGTNNVQGTPLVVTSLAARADYENLKPVESDPKHPLPPELVMARYAVAIAESADAPHLAAESFARAKASLAAAEDAQGSKKAPDRARVPQLAREAIQTGEDARAAAETRRAGTALESLRQQLADRDIKLKEAADRDESARREVAALEARLHATESHMSSANRQDVATQLLSRWLVLEPGEGALAAHIQSDEGFVKGKVDLSPETRERLSLAAGILLGMGNATVAVTPALQLSEDPAKLALSQRRARAVMEWLASLGVKATAGVPAPSTGAEERALAPGAGVDLLISFAAAESAAPAAADKVADKH